MKIKRYIFLGAGFMVILGLLISTGCAAKSIIRNPMTTALTPETPTKIQTVTIEPSAVSSDLSRLHATGFAPDVDIAKYRLTIDGLVDNALVLSYEELMRYPTVTDDPPLICKGVFTDNAQWTGIPVPFLLSQAVVKPQATQVTFYALDGYKQTLLLKEVSGDGIFLAHTVDGQVLPKDHGYPLRLVVSAQYGNYWVKWVERIEVH